MDDSAIVPLLEALYAFELDDEEWLLRALGATQSLCGGDHSYLGYFYDASDTADFKVWNVQAIAQPPEVEGAFRAAQLEVSPALLMATLRSVRVGSIRRAGMPYVAPLFAARERVGWGDIFSVNGLDPSGLGCLFTIGTRAPEFAPPARDVSAYERIAQHLATAFRLRRRVGASQVPAGSTQPIEPVTEAVLDWEGGLLHAQGQAAEKSSRERIRVAAQAIARLRDRDGARSERARAGLEALDAWRPLVGARWTLVDSFEDDGQRYIVARENQSSAPRLESLTEREQQVVLQALLGFSNKEIAYALGISDSTVRVLMARAAAKLGVRTRAELLLHPALQATSSGRR